MKPSTIAALDRINRRFYDEQADDFDQTRQGPWAGWARVVDAVRARLPEGRPLTVLDVGCGNGRFGRFLAEALPDVEIRWAGLDASEPLVNRARSLEDLPNLIEPTTRVWHLLGPDGEGPPALPRPSSLWANSERRLSSAAGDGTGRDGRSSRGNRDDRSEPVDGVDGFDLVVAFGVFHHVPGTLQADVLTRMLEATRPGGISVASFWQFAELPHYAGRRIPWFKAQAAGWVQEEDVAACDDDDWLLRWGASGELRARYCRATGEPTARRLVDACGPRVRAVDWFRADGRTGALNLYARIERI